MDLPFVRYIPPDIPLAHTSRERNKEEVTYNTAARPQRLSLTPKLIPVPLDIIHPIEDDKTVAS